MVTYEKLHFLSEIDWIITRCGDFGSWRIFEAIVQGPVYGG